MYVRSALICHLGKAEVHVGIAYYGLDASCIQCLVLSWVFLVSLLSKGSQTVILLVCDPGINHRQPLSTVASSSAIHSPITLPSGSVYRNVASWCGVTKNEKNLLHIQSRNIPKMF